MEGSPIEDGSARDCPSDQGEGLRTDRTMMGDEEKPGAVRTPNGRVVGAAQLPRGLDQRFQHRLQIEGGATEDLEHVGGGRLLLQGFAQLVEQARVLDGDDCLIGKGSHQLDLFRSKWLRHGFRYKDHPYDMSFAQKRDAERGSVAAKLLSLTPGILRVRQHIGNLNHSGL